MRRFERLIVDGVREVSGVPVVQAGESEMVMVYGDHNELSAIRFEYPVDAGRAYMNLRGYLSYPSSDITRAGIGIVEGLVLSSVFHHFFMFFIGSFSTAAKKYSMALCEHRPISQCLSDPQVILRF